MRCSKCGYTEHDAQIHGDHRLCPNYGIFKGEERPALQRRVLLILASGCSACEYDEAEGGLIYHCVPCARRVIREVWELMQ